MYMSNGTLVDSSKSLITIGIIDDCPAGSATYNTLNSLTGGPGTQFPVGGFGEVFITGTSGKDINSYLVSVGVCGKNAGPGGTGPAAIPVRLVQTP